MGFGMEEEYMSTDGQMGSQLSVAKVCWLHSDMQAAMSWGG